MQLFPIPTPILKKGDDLARIFAEHAAFLEGDVVVVSSKAVATVEGAAVDLRPVQPSDEAVRWAKETGSRTAAFLQATLDETKRLNGRVVGACPGAILTEVVPAGFPHGTILTANAGMDESNVEKGWAVGWPRDPVASAGSLRRALEKETGGRIAVILTDSCCRPRRWGVTAFALTAAGIDPLRPQEGKEDLFGRKLRITTEAVADQLATAANYLMGNAGQSVPAVIVRGHGLPLSDFEGWVPGIAPDEDLFRGVI
ncbi:MAG: coenzyme F420-0:L-glutamate ligase [Candidatus Peribacteraceae bacterium]|nr:coenzyme F420-0:L-glutamate ligase [Candidatus Peribacteraceae bacterium]